MIERGDGALLWHKKWFQFALIEGVAVAIIALICFVVVHMMPGFLQVLQGGNESEIEAYLNENAGIQGMVCTGILQFLQVISIVFPGMPIQFAAGIVYGTWKGFVLCHVSYLAANLCVFLMARRFKGHMGSSGSLEKKFRKLDFIKNSKNPGYMTALACLIPVLPKGIVPYVACQTGMTARHFVFSAWCGSLFPILAMCAIGSRVMAGEYFLAIGLLIVFLIAVVLLSVFRKQVIGFGKTLLPKQEISKQKMQEKRAGE